ncbi:transposase [Stutzerimonas zhaodongensis]|uniref:Transposase n=1 Tax=Stutzerimonas zhaodongensis TaxID=1176257 RepID=A0ABX8J180_9GAMM|nr:transposase [Stutzerimonas zhaodongensis]QWV18491.1 transposase [Stutzerimonas zhaodongensis]
MPRRSRLVLPGVPLHLIQRGNNRQICFVADEDFAVYLHWLHQYADETGCRLHAYALMTNHVHLLISADRNNRGNNRGQTTFFGLLGDST